MEQLDFNTCFSLAPTWHLELMDHICVQNHGFDFENEIRRVFHLPSEKNNTDKWDIPKSKNIFDPNENISVKSTGGTSIACSDIIRFYTIDFSDINTLIVGRYKQKGFIKDFYNIMEINYDKKLHGILFGECPIHELNEYVQYIKTVSKKDRSEYLKRKKDLQKKYNMAIVINPKVDSKGQRRVQCSIPFKLFDANDVYIKTVETIRGHTIKRQYKSPRRKFN